MVTLLLGEKISVRRMGGIIYLFLASFCKLVNSHAALTFPPARQLDLDFLDFVRTKGPCGMPKGQTKTTLITGSMVNVTWHLAYPHRGGFRIELLDKDEKVMQKLSDPDSNATHVTGDPTAQWHMVKIPDEPCEDCTIRLLRPANEWKGYGYWSCGDVSIVKESNYKEDCFGRGKPTSNSMCECDKGFWGPRCQYKDECSDDSDCNKGKCIDIGGTSLPRKQCYCEFGFHGERCQLQNKDTLPTPENLELSSHKKTVLTDRIQLYHKIISGKSKDDSELEAILIVNGTSYIAFGFRPSSIDQSCQEMPIVEGNKILTRKTRSAKGRMTKSNPTLLEPLNMPDKIKVEMESMAMNYKRSPSENKSKKGKPTLPPPVAEPETVSEPSSEIRAEPEPEGTSEPAPEPENEPKSEPEGTSETKAEPEAITEPQGEPEVTSEPEANSEPNAEPEASSEIKAEPEGSSEPNSEPESSSEPEAASEPSAEPEGSSEPEPEATPSSAPKTKREPSETNKNPKKAALRVEPEAAADDSMSSNVYAEPEPEQQSSSMIDAPSPFKLEKRRTEWTPPKKDFHPMDCSDVIIGTARGMYSRVRDYYTRDRSTPKLDTYWGGTEDITSATGWEKDGVTLIIFRRKLKSTDPTDHTIAGTMHVIFARGQEHGQYVHNPPSGLEAEKPSIPNFYSQDEIKYHGQSSQRGVQFIKFD